MTETFIQSDGIEIPKLGLGVYQVSPEEAHQAALTALTAGYRMIDTAAAYFNEEGIGRALAETDVPLDEIYVQTKLWMTDYGRDATLHAFDRSMKKLGLDVLDSWIMHWPVPMQFERTIDSWKTMIELKEQGRIRSIGMSNSSIADLQRLTQATGITPAANQVELHPYLTQHALRDEATKMGVLTQAWSPIGGIARYAHDGNQDPLQDGTLKRIAETHGKTVAQVILRWHIQHGVQVIPKSINPERIRENIDVFDFALTADDMQAIDALDRGARGGPNPAEVTPETFGIHIQD